MTERLASLESSIQAKDEALIEAVNQARMEGDEKTIEEQKRLGALLDKSNEEMETLKVETQGEITRLRAEYDEKIENLEERLQVALGTYTVIFMELFHSPGHFRFQVGTHDGIERRSGARVRG